MTVRATPSAEIATSRIRTPVRRWTVAVCIVAAAAVLTFAAPLPTPREKQTLVFLFAAIIAASAYGGLGPGLAATAVATGLTAYVVFEASVPASLWWWDLVRLAAFATIGVLSALRSGRLARTAVQREELLRREREARAEAEAANQTKDRFLAVLAHELRNPLAPIRNALYLLRSDAAARPYVAIIERQTRSLGRLVEDLLDVARLRAGKLTLRREPVEVSTVLTLAVETARPVIDNRHHTLVVRPPSGPLFCHGDEARLAQVVANLLENAAKFTELGGTITLVAERDGDDTVLRVRDTGIGIDPGFAARMFEVFVQGDRRPQAAGGLGIGLSLVRELVDLHGGRLEAHSGGVGQGAEFVVRLPAIDATVGEPAAPAPATPAGRALRVLVVEDNRDAGETMATMLRLWGHHVQLARDGTAALAAAARFQPEVVFLDVGLPGMNGFEVARRLRAQPESHEATVVGLSGYGQDSDRTRATAAGFDRYLVKPAEPDAIEAMLAEVSAERVASVSRPS